MSLDAPVGRMKLSPARCALSALALCLFAVATPAGELKRQSWTVDGVEREALVSVPAGAAPAAGWPLVFAYHGHGGSMRQAARSFPIHELWPEAIVVYPQGLPTPGVLVDPQGKSSGWQGASGKQGDRDVKFFDTMLAAFTRERAADAHRVYVTGHSNGGQFTYLLWALRGDALAAVAPSSGLIVSDLDKLRPKPVLHLGSPQDRLVKFVWQARIIDTVLELNGCGPRDPNATGYKTYPSSKGADVATFLHDGGHRFPSAEATPLIVKFFQTHPGVAERAP